MLSLEEVKKLKSENIKNNKNICTFLEKFCLLTIKNYI